MTAFLFQSLSDSEAATIRLAERFAKLLRARDVIGLEGPLGAGKSVFARAVIRSLTGDPDLSVPSPSFSLVQPYERANACPVIHADLYRVETAQELEELGLEDMFDEAITLVEWPEHGHGYLPQDRLTIQITPKEAGGRTIKWSGGPAWRERLAGLGPEAGS